MHSFFNNIKKNLKAARLSDALLPLTLGMLISFFVAINGSITPAIFFILQAAILGLWLFFLSNNGAPQQVLKDARISLSPFLILALLLPYNFFFAQSLGSQALFSLIIILLGSLKINQILNCPQPSSHSKISLLLISYFILFSLISILRHLNFQDTNSFDVGIYNQIQWNNIHGHFFESSVSGSNFVTHNSPFLILLSPFYALYPHPPALLMLKTLAITLSAIPFYLIISMYLPRSTTFPLLVAYLFYPSIVGQNFNAPHEMCFLPPFLLFSFYFFLKNRFKSFMFFLLLCLTIKEHVSLVACMYGLYALFLKRDKKWIILPLILGITWAAFSLWIMHHFQQIYHQDPQPAWLIENLKHRFLHGEGLKTSVMADSNSLSYVYLLFSAVGIFLPLCSPIILLGLPELGINLLANFPLFYPTWHYTIIISCFILIACVEGIKTLSSNATRTQQLLSWGLCMCILSHFFLWSNTLELTHHPRYVNTMNEAIQLIPSQASVSAPTTLVGYVSSRRDYYLLSDTRLGDYILVDSAYQIQSLNSPQLINNYVQIFNRDGIAVYKKRF